MAASSGASSISVTVRVRPFTIREAAQLTKCDDGPLFLGDGSLAGVPTPKLSSKGLRSVIKVVDDKCLVFDPPEDNPVQRFSRSVVPQGKRVKDQTFAFDRIFDDNVTQGEVYEATTRNLLDSVLDGYNATVFAYGATGCGKTHTITGTPQQPGIIFMTMQELFEKISDISEEKTTEISLSYLEIYNEMIRDLLVEGGSNVKGGLQLREDANQTVSVAGLSSHHPQNVQEVMDMIMRGNEYRTMSPTEANATSSRSHAVIQINVSTKDRNADVNEPHTMATLSIIDLAGSERASATKNRGERLTEGANINKSLLALGSCINALCDSRRRNHVPYRNSKLTRLLKFSLGGNCKTVMIVCVSPSSAHFDETQNTLRYANRAKNIQTKVTRNVFNVNRHVKDFLVKIDEQRALIEELRQQQKDYDNVAFAKFKKQSEKRETISREAVMRIRSSYEHSSQERQERLSFMSKLRQISRRIALLSSWIAAFDSVCDNYEDEEPLQKLQAIRKTAQGMLVEFEGSRQHYHQRLAKCNWERAMNSALENGVRQLKEVGGDETEFDNLTREVELLKSNAEREALSTIAEQEKSGDAATVQVLLQAQFETVAAIERIMHMSESEALSTGRKILGKMMADCIGSTSNVVKPDGSLAPVEAFAPTKTGTPKRKRTIDREVLGAAPSIPQPPLNAALAMAPQLAAISSPKSASPMKSSPRRRKFGGPRKGVSVSFSPSKKKTPVKRGVRWRDDTEEGTLAEFEKTPQRVDTTPEISSTEPTLPVVSTLTRGLEVSQSTEGSSPIPPLPEASSSIVRPNNRFKTGFLSKKSDGSPTPPSLTNLSDSDHSPLRDLEPSKAHNRSSLSTSPLRTAETASNSSSDNEITADRSDVMKIKSAIKRQSLAAGGGIPMSRTQRRRSPTATASSPPQEGMFTASHARRMVRSEKENNFSVLSPRTAPIQKGPGHASRRMTIGDNFMRQRDVSGPREGVRLSSTAHFSGGSSRSSLLGSASKNPWR